MDRDLEQAVGRDNRGNLLIMLDTGWAASKYVGKEWKAGIQYAIGEIFNGSFADVEPEEATAIYKEAVDILGLVEEEDEIFLCHRRRPLGGSVIGALRKAKHDYAS